MTIIIRNVLYVLITLFITQFFVACSNDDDNPTSTPKEVQMTVVGKGSSVIQAKVFDHPKTSEELNGGCFLMDLVDPNTGESIGTLEDCIITDTDNGDGTVTSRVITTINLHGRGSVTAENQVLQTPTDIAGILTTSFNPSENNIINATHEFEGATGTVSLIGEVDVTSLQTGVVVFNCSFTVNLITP